MESGEKPPSIGGRLRGLFNRGGAKPVSTSTPVSPVVPEEPKRPEPTPLTSPSPEPVLAPAPASLLEKPQTPEGELELRATGKPKDLKLANKLRKRIRKHGDFPPSGTESLKVSLEISLKEEWNNQSQKLANLFAQELRLTEEEYIATLPKFEPQPESWKGRFDIPVIVETRVPLKRMLELIGIVKYFDVDSIKDWKEGQFNTPKTPYTAWLNDGTPNLNKSVEAVRESLKADERGGNIYDGIALFLKDPKILDNHYLSLPGSQVGSIVDAFSLDRGRGWPGLDLYSVDHACHYCGSVVAGKL